MEWSHDAMRLVKGTSSITLLFNGSSATVAAVFATSSEVPFLEDGDIAPASWQLFTEGANGDGYQTNVAGDETDTLIGDNLMPVRFITPWQNDFGDTDYIDLVAHPYCGFTESGEQNTYDIFVYLNGGPPVKAVQRQRPGLETVSEYTVYSVRVPTGWNPSRITNEIRAIAIPKYGKPAILQRGMTSGTLVLDSRGVMIHKYERVTVGPGGTYANMKEAQAAEVKNNIKGELVGSSYEEGAIFTYSDCIVPTNTAGLLFDSDGLTPYPYVYSSDGSGVVIASNTGDSFVNASSGVLLKNCQIYSKPNPNTTIQNVETDPRCPIASTSSFVIRNNDFTPYFQCVDCTGGIKNSSDYTAETSIGQSHVDAGFAAIQHLYELGFTIGAASALSLTNTRSSSKGVKQATFGCTWKYAGLLATEAVDCISDNRGPGTDVYNANLAVNCHDYASSGGLYPWLSARADTIKPAGHGFDYRRDEYSNNDPALPDDQDEYSFNQIQANELDKDNAKNEGIWPDFVGNIDTDGSEVPAPAATWVDHFFKQEDGTYIDHQGRTRASWDFPWSNPFDPHVDSYQWSANNRCLGAYIIHACRSFGSDLERQVVFMTNASALSLAIWDIKASRNDNSIVVYRTGIRDGASGFTSERAGQHWGPDMYKATISDLSGASVPQDSFNSYLAYSPNPDDHGGFLYTKTTSPEFSKYTSNANNLRDNHAFIDAGQKVNPQTSNTFWNNGNNLRNWSLIVLDRP
jgi:hypothetical protein